MPAEVTRILNDIAAGQRYRTEELHALLYEELRAYAGRLMAGEPAGHTLQPTALVNEAYLRLVGDDEPSWEGRAHFFGAAAEAMRRILVERARKYAAAKHGGGRQRVALSSEDVGAPVDTEALDVLALHEALGRLETIDARMAEVVKLRYFAGLTVDEVARVKDVSDRTVIRAWVSARAWLYRELHENGEVGHGD